MPNLVFALTRINGDLKIMAEQWTPEQYKRYAATGVTPGEKAPKPKHNNKRKSDVIALVINTANRSGAEEVQKEFKFHPERRWRFDLAWPGAMIAVEYEGIFSSKSGHTTVGGYTGDCEKYNEAALLGWTLLRFTPKTKDSVIMNQMIAAFENVKSREVENAV